MSSNGIGGMSLADQLRNQLKALEDKESSAITHAETVTSAASYVWPEKFSIEQRKKIGAAIRELRKKNDFTQGRLEKLVGLSAGNMSQIEDGRVAWIDKAFLKKLGNFLRNDFNEIVMKACSEFKPRVTQAIEARDEAEADPFDLLEDEEKVLNLRDPKGRFEFRCKTNSTNFSIDLVKAGVVTNICSGKRSKDELFVRALERVASLIKRGV